MTTFNKILLSNMENQTISKENYYKILNLLAIIKENRLKENELNKEKQNLLKDLSFIKSLHDRYLHDSIKNEIMNNINLICNKTEIDLYQSTLSAKQKIFEIIPSIAPQYTKSSTSKYNKQMKKLLKEKEKIEKEIKYNKNELRFLKGNTIQNQIFENYINNLIQKKLPKIKKEILKQKYYAELFSQIKGR